MTEAKQSRTEYQPSKEDLTSKWDGLSSQAKEATLMLTHPVQRLGMRFDYFKSLDSPEETLAELVKTGLVEIKSRKEIAQEYVEVHQAKVAQIRAGITRISMNLTQAESTMLNLFDSEYQISQREEDHPRYRLTDGVLDFLQNFK